MCPKTFKNTNTYYKHVRKDHGDKYAADSSVAKKYLLFANTPTSGSSSADTDSNGCSHSIADPGSVSNLCNSTPDDNTIDLNPENSSVESDATKVASGHLIQLKCKAGVTQSILPSIVEMNEAVVDSVLDNVSWKVAERLHASQRNWARRVLSY